MKDIEGIKADLARALEQISPASFLVRLFAGANVRLRRAASRIGSSHVKLEATSAYPAFYAAWREMLDVLRSLDRGPYDITAIDAIVGTINDLHRGGILNDALRQEAVQTRRALDGVVITHEYEESAGVSGSDPCPPTTYTVMTSPANLDF